MLSMVSLHMGSAHCPFQADNEAEMHGAPLDDPYIWCLLHPKLKGLPRVYMNSCGADTLRDDARLMKELLDKNGYFILPLNRSNTLVLMPRIVCQINMKNTTSYHTTSSPSLHLI